MPKTFICANCGSDNVRKDAYAYWDKTRQEWVLHGVFDNNVCESCGDDDATLEEAEVTVGTPAVPLIRIVTPLADVELPIAELNDQERQALAKLLGFKSARQDAFKVLRDCPKFRKIKNEEVWATCPKGAKHFPIELEIILTNDTVAGRAANLAIKELLPDAEASTAIHRMSGVCPRCNKVHAVERHSVMVKATVAGIPFSQLYEA